MQDFRQPPGGPLQNPLDGSFQDPFEAMSKAFGPDANFDLFNPFDYTQVQLEKLFMDDLGKMLNRLEDTVENLPPIPAEPEMPDFHMEPFDNANDVFSPTQHNNQNISPEQATADTPALPYYIEEPRRTGPSHKPLHLPTGRIGRGGRGFKSFPGVQSDQTYCPIRRAFVSVETTCDDCDYYDEDGDPETGSHCTYYSDEES